MKLAVVVNDGAGTLARLDGGAGAVERAFREAGVEATVALASGPGLPHAVEQAFASDADAVVIGGGDGTVSAAADLAVRHGKPIGILPLGTLNHFARDLGMPLDLPGAVRAIATGAVREIDVGEVNGRIFVNNSSIGIYPGLIKDRDEQRLRLGRGKWWAMLRAILGLFWRIPLLGVRVVVEGTTIDRRTPFVFIGNNRYEMSLLSISNRRCLDGGELQAFIGNRTGRLGLLKLASLTLLGRVEQAREVDILCPSELWIESRRPRLHVAADGEVVDMRPPLHYRIRQKALRVIAPRRPEPA